MCVCVCVYVCLCRAAGPTPSASSLNSMSDSAGSDAHMAAQQLIMLMSSGKEAEGGTLKQLQMLLQSAANSTNTSTPTLSSTPPSAVPPQPLRPSLQATSATATSAAAPIPSSVRLSPPHMRMGATLAPGEPVSGHVPYLFLTVSVANQYCFRVWYASFEMSGVCSLNRFWCHASILFVM